MMEKWRRKISALNLQFLESDFSEDFVTAVDRYKRCSHTIKPQALFVANGKVPEVHKRLVKQTGGAFLQQRIKVDHHISAEDQMKLVETGVRGKVMLMEGNALPQLVLHHDSSVNRGTVVG